MKITDRLEELAARLETLKNTSVATDPAHAKKYAEWQKEKQQCEEILAWFQKEKTKPNVQMSLDPYLAKGQIRLPLTNLTNVDFQEFSFDCVAMDYNSRVLETTHAACALWRRGQLMEFRFAVPKDAKSVMILAESIAYEPLPNLTEEDEELLVETTCRYCKKEIVPFAKFCNHCGKQLMTDEERVEKRAKVIQREIKEEKTRYLKVLDELSITLKEKELCDKISHLREISEKVYARIAERPDMVRGMHKFDNIYLPAIENAVKTYVSVRDGGVDLENVEKSRNDAELAIDIGIHSSQKLLNSLYRGDQLDVETDIDVLKQMFTDIGSQATTAPDGEDSAANE